jgi:hypothetical protein
MAARNALIFGDPGMTEHAEIPEETFRRKNVPIPADFCTKAGLLLVSFW